MLAINPFAIPPFISSILILCVSLYIFLLNPRSQIHRSFLYFCLSLFVWLFCYSFLYNSTSQESATKWMKLSFYGVAFIPLTNFYFYINALDIRNKKGITVSLFFIVLIFIFLNKTTPYVYDTTWQYFWGFYTKAGFLHTVFLTLWSAIWVYGLHLVYQKMQGYKKSGDYLAYNRAKYLYIGYLGECLGFVDFLPKYGFPIYPFGYISTVYWVIIVSFTLTKRKMLTDISFLTRRVFIASAILGFVTSVFCISFIALKSLEKLSISINTTISFSIVSLILGLTFQPIFRRIKNYIDRIFFPEYYDRKERLSKLGEEILLTKDSNHFSRLLLENIFNLFKITKVSMFTWNEQEKIFKVQASSGWNRAYDYTEINILQDDEIVKYLLGNQYILIDQLKQDLSKESNYRSIILSMLKLDISCIIPIKSNINLLGFFVLGEKESGLPYSLDDLNTLSVLANHAALALDNIDMTNRWTIEMDKKRQINDVLHRYMSSSIADEVLSKVNITDAWKGERKYVTILVADLRGFTNATENNSPEEIVQLLNEYLSEMVEIIISYGGTIDKFMGDGVLVVFGAPNEIANHELAAIKCALSMQKTLNELNKVKLQSNMLRLQMGIALTSGDVISGNIGSDKRMEYTVIGDPVNLAARLQASARAGQILATPNVIESYPEVISEILPSIDVKGKTKPIDIIEIKDLKKSLENNNDKGNKKWEEG